jgi:hypothetical protein
MKLYRKISESRFIWMHFFTTLYCALVLTGMLILLVTS